MAQRAIALPFSINSAGGIGYTTNESKIWADRVFLVLMTILGERVQRPTFGSGVKNAIFETEASAISLVTDTVDSAFSTWLPQLTLLDTQIALDDETLQLAITISYRLPNLQEDTLTINTGVFSRSGDLIREIS